MIQEMNNFKESSKTSSDLTDFSDLIDMEVDIGGEVNIDNRGVNGENSDL